MFLIIPLIIIFLLSSYLILNDVSLIVEIIVYILILAVVIISLYLYKSIRKNMIQQEINAIQIDINKLIVQLQKVENEKEKEYILHKIELLQEQKEKLT